MPNLTPKKYIINSLSEQTITGNITIDGDTEIKGTLTSNIAVYRALLTQTGPITGTNIGDFNWGLIIGDVYTIDSYQTGDDFSNIASIVSGNQNETGCVFVADGQVPLVWSNGSQLTSSGILIVHVLENTLGFPVNWTQTPYGGDGYYVCFNGDHGPLTGQFPRSRTEVKSQLVYSYDWIPPLGLPPIGIVGVGSSIYDDDTVYIDVYEGLGLSNNSLYYTPFEIHIKKDMDTTPINVYGFNVSGLPYGNVSVRLFAGFNEVGTFTNSSYVVVNNVEEIVAALNADPNTNFLGTYSVNGNVIDGVILTMATNTKNQFSPNAELTFEVFSD